jgi:hypothetical protein
MPRDWCAVDVDGRDTRPSHAFALSPSALALRVVAADAAASPVLPVPAFVSVEASPVEGVDALGEAHADARSADGETPADACADRQDELGGVPLAPFPSAPLAEKSSDALVGSAPHAVPRPTSVGTAGDASAVVQVDAFVGSCAEPTPSADAPNDPAAVEMIVARTRESDVDTVVRLASASAHGPLVVVAGTLPLGGDGSGSAVEAPTGALALVPLAVVDPPDCPAGPAVVVLDAAFGSLDEMPAGPASPPLCGRPTSGRTLRIRSHDRLSRQLRVIRERRIYRPG